MLIVLLYNFGVYIYKGVVAIAAAFGNAKARLFTDGRRGIFEKMAVALADVRRDAGQVVWIHVASLGEFEQGRPVIEKLKQNAQTRIVLTFFSPSGYELRKNYPLADGVFYLPLDTPRNARRFLDLVKPDLAIFVKYEFWYHYLHELKRRNVPTLLISGIFRESQFGPFYGAFLKKMLACFTHFFVQNGPSVSLLQKHGFPNVTLAGDTRIDRVVAIAQEAQRFPVVERFVGDAPVFIGGSTWQPDENIIATLLQNPQFNRWKVIIAPHEIKPQNIARVRQLFEPHHPVRYSDFSQINDPAEATRARVLIVDNIGMLSALYRYGKIAYIGGGFGRGIHNTLEPIAWGIPVIFGPRYQKFEEAVQLIHSGGGFSVAQTDDFQEIINKLIQESTYKEAAQAAQNYISQNRGATEKIALFLQTQGILL